ncbi:MAG: septum formation family protein [Kineosporiaceae bacterium]
MPLAVPAVAVTAPSRRRRRRACRAGLTTCVALLLASTSGCSVPHFGDDSHRTSVMQVKAGDCVVPPAAVQGLLSELTVVDCGRAHPMEAYAVVPYRGRDGGVPAVYPGQAALKAFADGACLETFRGYVGVDYRDSSLFFTYLMPTARDWREGRGDISVTCFVTTTGPQFTSTVRDTKA